MYRNLKDHNGNTYDTIKEMCYVYNVQPKTYLKRIERGWSVEESLTGIHKRYTCNGKGYHSLKDIAIKNNVNPQTFLRRVRNGLTIEEALK